jgi:hypothetical protein
MITAEDRLSLVEAARKGVPEKIKKQPRWVLWARGEGGKPVLYQASEHILAQADPRDPYTWAEFETALKSFTYNSAYEGLAYINSPNRPLLTIRLFRAIQGKKIAPWAFRYLDMLGAYAEEGHVPGSITVLWEGPLPGEKPFTSSSASVSQPPYIIFTLRRIPGTPPIVGSSPKRLAKFLETVQAHAEKLGERRASQMASLHPLLGVLAEKLKRWGVVPKGDRAWVSFCPVCQARRPTLHIAYKEGSTKILLYCENGCPKGEILERLGLSSEEGSFYTPSQPAVEEPLPPIPEDHPALPEVELSVVRLFSPEGEELARRLDVSLEVLSTLGMGVTQEGNLLFVARDPQGRIVGLRTYNPEGKMLGIAYPGHLTPASLLLTGEPPLDYLYLVPRDLMALRLSGVLWGSPKPTGVVSYDENVPISWIRTLRPQRIYVVFPGGVSTEEAYTLKGTLKGWKGEKYVAILPPERLAEEGKEALKRALESARPL